MSPRILWPRSLRAFSVLKKPEARMEARARSAAQSSESTPPLPFRAPATITSSSGKTPLSPCGCSCCGRLQGGGGSLCILISLHLCCWCSSSSSSSSFAAAASAAAAHRSRALRHATEDGLVRLLVLGHAAHHVHEGRVAGGHGVLAALVAPLQARLEGVEGVNARPLLHRPAQRALRERHRRAFAGRWRRCSPPRRGRRQCRGCGGGGTAHCLKYL